MLPAPLVTVLKRQGKGRGEQAEDAGAEAEQKCDSVHSDQHHGSKTQGQDVLQS